MRIFLILMILTLIGCTRARDIILPMDNSIRGIWHGKFSATYSGPDCGAISVEDSIRFIFTDVTFTYFWQDDIDSTIAGRGTYYLESNIVFTNEIESTIDPPLTIDGPFHMRFIRPDAQPDTMILSQGEISDINSFFETIYLVTLVKSEEMAE